MLLASERRLLSERATELGVCERIGARQRRHHGDELHGSGRMSRNVTRDNHTNFGLILDFHFFMMSKYGLLGQFLSVTRGDLV